MIYGCQNLVQRHGVIIKYQQKQKSKPDLNYLN